MTGLRQITLLLFVTACGGAPPHPRTPVTPPPSVSTSVEIGKTTILPDVIALGIDPTKDTDLSAIDPTKKKKLMRLFAKALGTDCSNCHADDFKDDTRNKRLARHMWKDFVAGLRDADGQAIFCDSCHQGKTQIIARDDDKILAEFMKKNYVGKLKRADNAEHKCATCHGEPFDPDIFKNKFHAEGPG